MLRTTFPWLLNSSVSPIADCIQGHYPSFHAPASSVPLKLPVSRPRLQECVLAPDLHTYILVIHNLGRIKIFVIMETLAEAQRQECAYPSQSMHIALSSLDDQRSLRDLINNGLEESSIQGDIELARLLKPPSREGDTVSLDTQSRPADNQDASEGQSIKLSPSQVDSPSPPGTFQGSILDKASSPRRRMGTYMHFLKHPWRRLVFHPV